jgi:hypothetical protein
LITVTIFFVGQTPELRNLKWSPFVTKPIAICGYVNSCFSTPKLPIWLSCKEKFIYSVSPQRICHKFCGLFVFPFSQFLGRFQCLERERWARRFTWPGSSYWQPICLPSCWSAVTRHPSSLSTRKKREGNNAEPPPCWSEGGERKRNRTTFFGVVRVVRVGANISELLDNINKYFF